VLRLIAKGMTQPETARLLGISAHTVAGYVKDLYRKLNVSSARKPRWSPGTSAWLDARPLEQGVQSFSAIPYSATRETPCQSLAAVLCDSVLRELLLSIAWLGKST